MLSNGGEGDDKSVGTVIVIWGNQQPYRKPLQSNHWSKIFDTCAGISCAIYS